MTAASTARILVVIGTPLAASLNHALAAAYAEAAAAAGAEVRTIDLARDEIPGFPTLRDQLRVPRSDLDVPVDPDVARYVADLAWADHIAVFFPQWWGTMPGALKSFFDRVLLSGFAYRYRDTGKLWDRLLAGRTARIVMTMDSPGFWNQLVYRNAAETSLKNAILGYCGVKTLGITRFTEVRHTDADRRRRWIRESASLGSTDGARSASRSPRARSDASADLVVA